MQPVDAAGQHAVEDDRVERLARGHEQAVAAVVGMLDDMAGFAQAAHDEAGDVLVVLHHQDAHRLVLPGPVQGCSVSCSDTNR